MSNIQWDFILGTMKFHFMPVRIPILFCILEWQKLFLILCMLRVKYWRMLCNIYPVTSLINQKEDRRQQKRSGKEQYLISQCVKLSNNTMNLHYYYVLFIQQNILTVKYIKDNAYGGPGQGHQLPAHAERMKRETNKLSNAWWVTGISHASGWAETDTSN